MNEPYTGAARYLHWVIAGLIVLQFVLAKWAEFAADANTPLQQLALLANHKSIGMTILMLAVVRVIWRALNTPPSLPSHMATWQVWASKTAHWLLYGLLFALPLSGWLMSSASAYAVSWFNLFTFPDLVAADENLKSQLTQIHELLSLLLFFLASVHILAALFHHFRDKDDILKRITSPGSLLLGLALVIAGVWQLGFATQKQASPTKSTHSQQTTSVEATMSAAQITIPQVVGSDLPRWNIDYASSHIEFSAEQAGAQFAGSFSDWQAEIQFDPQQLDQSQATVLIHLASVNTQDKDRDATLDQPEWFGGRRAQFSVNNFEALASNEYVATNATLNFGKQAHPIEFKFTYDAQRATLSGEARLDRLALGIGTGEWLDTTWVGQFVSVKVVVKTE